MIKKHELNFKQHLINALINSEEIEVPKIQFIKKTPEIDHRKAFLALESPRNFDLLQAMLQIQQHIYDEFNYDEIYKLFLLTSNEDITVAEKAQETLKIYFEYHPESDFFKNEETLSLFFGRTTLVTEQLIKVLLRNKIFQDFLMNNNGFIDHFINNFYNFNIDDPILLFNLKIINDMFASKRYNPELNLVSFKNVNTQQLGFHLCQFLNQQSTPCYIVEQIFVFLSYICLEDSYTISDFITNIVDAYVENIFSCLLISNEYVKKIIFIIICYFTSCKSDISFLLYQHKILDFFNSSINFIEDEVHQNIVIKSIRNMIFSVQEFRFDFINSLFFEYIQKLANNTTFHTKRSIIKTDCALIMLLKEKIFDFFLEANMINLFIDGFSIENEKLFEYLINAIEVFINYIVKHRDTELSNKLIEELSTDDMLESFQTVIDESDDEKIIYKTVMLKEFLFPDD